VSNEVAIGSEVIVWARMREDVLLLFGEGVYEGMNYVNGQAFPVVKFNDGREVTMHYQGVFVGTKDSVARTCSTFPGVKIAFDLEPYLRGKRPTEEEISRLSQSSGNAKPAQLPEPKTLTDKAMNLKREIEYEENKRKMYVAQIEECEKKIAAKRAEISSIKAAVLKELEDIDASIPAAPQVTIAHETTTAMPAAIPLVAPAPVETYQPEPARDIFDAEAKRMALED
jgi:hypothetical protein